MLPMWGFESVKEVFDILLIPIVGGTIALLWPTIQIQSRARRFKALIERELEEVRPYSGQEPSPPWFDQLKKVFLHRRIFEEVSENRDFIISLEPGLAYNISQLWDAIEQKNATQWLFYLKQVSEEFPTNTDIAENVDRWEKVISRLPSNHC